MHGESNKELNVREREREESVEGGEKEEKEIRERGSGKESKRAINRE